MKYRFQWTYPIVFSPYDPKTMYATSNFVHKTTNGGQSWEVISPDLTRADTSTLKSSGGEITKDNTGAETFGTIFTFAESPVQKGVFWAGSDDGYMHISTDGAQHWQKLDIKGLPDWALMSMVEASHFDAGAAYLAANRYKLDDQKPYIFRTKDFGKTWTKITEGLPEAAYVRVVREDPTHKGLLFCGTEIGVFFSLNDGTTWQPLQADLPLTPIHDLQIQVRERDLCIATHGRGFWILDNLEPLYQLYKDPSVISKKTHLFQPEDAWRVGGGSFPNAIKQQVGENAPNGVLVNYIFKEKPKEEVLLRFLSENGDSIITFSSVKDRKGKALDINRAFFQKEKIERQGVAPVNVGMNTFVWDMRAADAVDTDPPALMWAASIAGPKVPPGKYFVEMVVGKEIISKQPFEIRRDPRIETTDADIAASFKYQIQVRDKLSETHAAVNELRLVRKQINDYMATVTDSTFRKDIEKVSKPLLDSLSKVEDELIQHRAKAPQDLLALPIKLNNKVAGLKGVAESADGKPTAQLGTALGELTPLIDHQLKTLKKVLDEEVPKFNKLADTKKASAIVRKDKS